MKIILLVITLLCTQHIKSQNPTQLQKKNPSHSFIKNEGQIIDLNGMPNDKVLYLLNTKGLNVQLRTSGFSYDVYETKLNSKTVTSNNLIEASNKFGNIYENCQSKEMETIFHRVDIDFLETSNNLVVKAYEVSKAYRNYYNVLGREEGITNVKSFKKIVYHNLYEGIDVEFFVPEDIKKPVEYNFIINPNGDISKIKMKISGAPVNLKNNSLNMSLIHGNLNEIIPRSWIQTNEKEKEVSIKYVEKGENIFGFESTNETYDKNSILIIDPTPVREWGTYFGGSFIDGNDYGSMDIDSNGDTIYATMIVSDNIATAGSHQPFNFIFMHPLLPATGFMMKFDPSGNLIWSTYYGGLGTTEFFDVRTDSQNNIVGVGLTYSDTHIATPNSHQALKGGVENDGFLVKFNSNGQRIWSSYYGGIGQDVITTVSIDGLGNIFIAGNTGSDDNIITPNAFDVDYENNINADASEAFIAKFDQDGNRMWGTYYGGSATDVISNIQIGNDSNLYIVGYTNSTDNIASEGAYKEMLTLNGPQTIDRIDTFVAKFNTNGNRIWGTYFGGDAIDWGYDLAIDNANNVIISGATQSTTEIAFYNAHQTNKGGDIPDWDDFIAKFNTDGALLWSSYYGGTERENYVNCSVDTDIENNIYLAGGTSSSSNIATVDSYKESFEGYGSAYLVKFDQLGNRIWGTYYGQNFAVTTDVKTFNDVIYLFGITSSDEGIASVGAHQEEVNYVDCFIVKFRECENFIEANVSEFLCTGENISLTASGGISYAWSGPNGFISNEQNPVISNANVTDSGTYVVDIVSDNGCNVSKTFQILVSERPMANPINDLEVCEDALSTGISSSIDTSQIDSQVLLGQTNMVVSYYGSDGNILPSPLPNPLTNAIPNLETITVRVAHENNLECYAETTFNLIVNPVPSINLINNLYSCDDDSDGFTTFDVSQVEATLLGGQTGVLVEYFYENGLPLPTPLPNTITNSVPFQENITARVSNANCSREIFFSLIVNPVPIANSLDTLVGCDDNADGISEYFDTSNVENQVIGSQNGMEVSYFDSSGNVLPNPLPNPFTNTEINTQNITVRVTNSQTGCYSETLLNLQTATQPNINQPNNLYACDEGNGIAHFDTSTIEFEIIGNQSGLDVFYFDDNGNTLPSPLPASFINTVPYLQTITARVENALNTLCYSETSFSLIVNHLPEISLEEEYFICNLEPSINLSVDPSFDSYQWAYQDGTIISTTSNAELVNEGSYVLTISQLENGISCENTFTFSLIRSVLPEIQHVNHGELGNNFIEIIALGDGDFEYSIDGTFYQDSNYFSNLKGGVYTVYVRDKYGCGEDSQDIVIVDYPKFFTPNDDGFNDYWHIKGITEFPNSKILIFDRYGKFISQLSSNDVGWDGFYNGSLMLPTDYWFTADLGNGNSFSGHFSLKL